MRKNVLILILSVAVFSTLWAQDARINGKIDSPVDWVNTLMGTDSKYELSHGNTYPAIARPWGMNFWTPQTGKMGDGWGYTYNANHIRGFKQTHQPSPWINDYGQFAIMPTTGDIKFNQNDRMSWFSHKSEIAKPYYYSVYLADYDVVTEITPTDRAARFRLTYPDSEKSNIIIDAFDKGSYIKVIPSENKIVGYTTKNSGGVPANFKNWFVIYTDKPIKEFYTWKDSSLYLNVEEQKANHVGAVVSFSTSKGEKVNLKVASSFISLEQAELNLKREIADNSFDQIKETGRDIWNKELSKIEIEGGEYEQIKTFYSCFYRILLFPRKFYEFDANGKMVHYSPYNGEIRDGYMFTDNGFWDTFRAVFPFFTLIYPEYNSQVMSGLVNTYLESGWLPEWASPGHRNCMIGSNSASIIADSYLKGIRGYDIEKLYEAMVKNSDNEGPLSSVGRKGVQYYNDLGYIPYDVKINENAARTLEYAYADYCLAKLAEELGKPQDEVDKFYKRAMNYVNLFDKESSLMRGKNKDGKFQTPFSPYKWGDAFTEGNSWHYTWSVFQDIEGLIQLMGGDKQFNTMLDSVFVVPPIFDDSYYGFPIHEIREMQLMNMGNYAHGNQPIQHMPYLYNYSGEPWKTQKWVRQIMKQLYSPTPDGYVGDEDNGQTSAWYVFSAIGFYSVTPGSGEYVLGSPIFDKITLNLENGEKFIIKAEDNSPENVYIESARLNGRKYDKNYITHSDILRGGTLSLDMSSQPNLKRGVGEESRPFSITKK